MGRSGTERVGRAARAGAAAAAALIAAGAASAASAQALDDKYWIEVSGHFPRIDTSATVSRPGRPGTEIDLEDDLDMNKRETVPAVYLGARLWDRWVVTGEYFRLDRHGSRTLSRDLVFDGDTFAAAATVDSKMSSDVYRLTINYIFLKREQWELGAGLGLHATEFDLRLTGAVRVGAAGLQTDTRRKDFLAPQPTIGVFGTYQPTSKVIINGRVEYLSVTVGDYGGGITNAQASVAYRATDMIQVGAGWRYVAYDLDVNKERYEADLDYNFSGPTVFLRLGFN